MYFMLEGGLTQQAIDLFRGTIDYVDAANHGLDDACLLSMIENGMEPQAKVWFWKTIYYRTDFNPYVIRQLIDIGLEEEAKALFEHSKRFCKPEDEERMNKTRRMLYSSRIYS